MGYQDLLKDIECEKCILNEQEFIEWFPSLQIKERNPSYAHKPEYLAKEARNIQFLYKRYAMNGYDSHTFTQAGNGLSIGCVSTPIRKFIRQLQHPNQASYLRGLSREEYDKERKAMLEEAMRRHINEGKSG